MIRNTQEKERALFKLKAVLYESLSSVESRYRSGRIDEATMRRYNWLWHWSIHRFSSAKQDRRYRNLGMDALNKRIALGRVVFEFIANAKVQWQPTEKEKQASEAVQRLLRNMKGHQRSQALERQARSSDVRSGMQDVRDRHAQMRMAVQIRLATQSAAATTISA